MRLPLPLSVQSKIAVVAPSSPAVWSQVDAGIQVLHNHHLLVNYSMNLPSRRYRYLAGTLEERWAEFEYAYVNSDVLFCVRGGYGAMHLLPRLDTLFKCMPPKLVIGFSDITAIGCALLKHQIPWVHGPLLSVLADEKSDSVQHLLSILKKQGQGLVMQGKETFTPGFSQGRLVGGSLSLLASLCGTPYFPCLDNCILFLEDVGEKTYRIDRLLTQLDLSGCLRLISGIVLGYFNKCETDGASYQTQEIIMEWAQQYRVPCLWGVLAGHASPHFALPMGAMVALDAQLKTLTFLEDIVS